MIAHDELGGGPTGAEPKRVIGALTLLLGGLFHDRARSNKSRFESARVGLEAYRKISRWLGMRLWGLAVARFGGWLHPVSRNQQRLSDW
jgi:hypothetical protein